MELRKGVKKVQREIKKCDKILKKNPDDKGQKVRFVKFVTKAEVYAGLLVKFNEIRKSQK